MVVVGRVMRAMPVMMPMPMMMPVPVITRPRVQGVMLRLCHRGGRPMRHRLGHRCQDQRQKRQHRRNPHQDRTDPAHRPSNTPATTVRLFLRR